MRFHYVYGGTTEDGPWIQFVPDWKDESYWPDWAKRFRDQGCWFVQYSKIEDIASHHLNKLHTSYLPIELR